MNLNSDTVILQIPSKVEEDIFRVCRMGKRDLLQLILKRFPDAINARDNVGRTALLLCCALNQTECVRFLLEKGADPFVRDTESNWTAFHYSLYYSCLRTTQILLEHIQFDYDRVRNCTDYNQCSPFDLLKHRFFSSSIEIVPSSPFKLQNSTFVSSFGSTSNYQLGYPTSKSHQDRAKIIKTLDNKDITKIAIGKFAAAAIDRDGGLFTWGINHKGLLGQSNPLTEPCTTPHHVHSDQLFSDIAVSDSHMIACTRSGKCFSWGKGVLGHSFKSNQHCNIPREILHLRNHYITIVAATSGRSVLISSENRVFVLGNGFNGHFNSFPEEIFHFHHEIVSQLAITSNSAIILSKSGKVFQLDSENRFRVIKFPVKDVFAMPSHQRTFQWINACDTYFSAISNLNEVFLWRHWDDPLIRLRVPRGIQMISGCCANTRFSGISSEGDLFVWSIENLLKSQSLGACFGTGRKSFGNTSAFKVEGVSRAFAVYGGFNCTVVLQRMWKLVDSGINRSVASLQSICEQRILMEMDLKNAFRVFSVGNKFKSSQIMNVSAKYIHANMEHFYRYIYDQMHSKELAELELTFESTSSRRIVVEEDSFDEFDFKFYAKQSVSVTASPVSISKPKGKKKIRPKQCVKILSFEKTILDPIEAIHTEKGENTLNSCQSQSVWKTVSHSTRRIGEKSPFVSIAKKSSVPVHLNETMRSPGRSYALSDFILPVEGGSKSVSAWSRVSSSAQSLAQIQREQTNDESENRLKTCWGVRSPGSSTTLTQIQKEQMALRRSK